MVHGLLCHTMCLPVEVPSWTFFFSAVTRVEMSSRQKIGQLRFVFFLSRG